MEEITQRQIIKEKEDDTKRAEKDKLFNNEMNKMENERKRQETNFEERLKKMEEKQEEVIHSGDIKGYFQIIREVVDSRNFNLLNDESKKLLIEKIIQNKPDVAETKNNDLECKILQINKFLDLFQEKSKKELFSYAGSLSNKVNFIQCFPFLQFLLHEQILQ